MKIVSGIAKYRSEVFPKMKGDFEALGSRQSPESQFTTCSDSRIAPDSVMPASPGEHLREHECVANAEKEGRIAMHGWVYHFENGEVEFLKEQAI